MCIRDRNLIQAERIKNQALMPDIVQPDIKYLLFRKDCGPVSYTHLGSLPGGEIRRERNRYCDDGCFERLCGGEKESYSGCKTYSTPYVTRQTMRLCLLNNRMVFTPYGFKITLIQLSSLTSSPHTGWRGTGPFYRTGIYSFTSFSGSCIASTFRS